MSVDSTNKPLLEIVKNSKKPTGKKTGNTGGSGGGGADKAQRFGEYIIKNNSFHQVKTVKAGPDGSGVIEIQLCDFTCKIMEEIISDDGLSDTSLLRVQGRRNDGLILPSVDVLAKDFYSQQGNWVNSTWGTAPIVYPGTSKKAHLQTAIHLCSRKDGDIPSRKVYKFVGWKQIKDQWHYLTGGGAITSDGFVTGIDVELGSGHMSRYQLPAPLTGEQLKQAMLDALALLDVCPSKPHIGVVLLAAVARAPLGECQAIDFVIWMHGLTGSKKSALAAIALGFFGNFTARSFPANWIDTVGSCEVIAHRSKDSVLVVDDFKPSTSRSEADKLHAFADRYIRGTGNQGGRNRLSQTAELNKTTPYNRSMTISTAEDLPRGQSLLGRMLIIEMARSDVENKVLTRLQHASRDGNLAGLMSAYIQWLAPRMDQLKMDFPKNIEVCRDAALREGWASSHPRASEIYANLVVGAETFLEFLEDVGGVSSEQINVLLSSIEVELKQTFSEQGAYLTEQDEVERFLQLLREAFSSGNAHISCRLDQGPPKTRPYSWGWRSNTVDAVGDKVFKPMGDCVGYYCEASGTTSGEVWLLQESAFKVVQQFARDQGNAFLMCHATLWRRMHERGFIIKTESDGKNKSPRLAVRCLVAGQYKRLMALSADLIESGQ